MNRTRDSNELQAMVEALGPAEKLVNLIINFPDHLWHNRPGVVRNGKWKAATKKEIEEHRERGRLSDGGEFRPAGPNEPAIVRVYTTLAEIWQANNELAARLASYIMRETDWRDMKMVCSAFMLVQNKSGEPVYDDEDGSREVLFHDDDYREVGGDDQVLPARIGSHDEPEVDPADSRHPLASGGCRPESAPRLRPPAEAQAVHGPLLQGGRGLARLPREQSKPAGRPQESRLRIDGEEPGPHGRLQAEVAALL